MAKQSVRAVRRDTGAASDIPLSSIGSDIADLFTTIHKDLYTKARSTYDSRLKTVLEWSDFVPWLNEKGICVIPWCEQEKCEDAIKARSAKECVLILSPPACV